MKLSLEDEYFDVTKSSLEIKRAKELDAINSMKTKMKKSKKKPKMKDYDSKLSDFIDNFRI